ncbi:MAG: DUF885 domain-containing protein [candidate division Zixibacteria bacterium]|nr:DUF885 domain-containing protein [candidate division Zixibacteria bacterium]
MNKLWGLMLFLGGMIFLLPAAGMCADVEVFMDKYRDLIANKGNQTDSARLHNLFKISWDHQMAEYPEWATYNGYPGYDSLWTDQSLEAIARRKDQGKVVLQAAESIRRENLSAGDKLNLDLYLSVLRRGMEGERFPGEYMPISQLGGVQQDLAQMLEIMPTQSETQYKNILARLERIPKVIEQSLVLMKKGLDAGVTPPQVTLRDVPDQVKNQIVDDPAQAPLLVAFTRFPADFPAKSKDDLTKQAYAVYKNKIVPALAGLHAYLVNTYLPGCRQSIGLNDLPDGKNWYAYNVKVYTTTDKTPDEIFEIGMSEVKRIKAQMQDQMKKTGWTGNYNDFCDYLRTDKQFYYESTEELLMAYRDIAKRADPELMKLFGRLPRTPYGVLPVPSYSEKSQTTAYYMPGSVEAGRAGYFFANTYDLGSRPKWEMEALSLHEAVPGHHLQISIAQELEGLPEFRKKGWFTAYGEGWGLYSESLGEEMGFYRDPYSKFGQLTYEMWRAIRLVVDVGMHYKGWSRQQAIDFFLENSCKAGHDVTVEVDRYIVWPGQALAYKIGELKIKELRAYAKRELADKFDVRKFHDQILDAGPLPLDVLEAKIKDWVSQTKLAKS